MNIVIVNRQRKMRVNTRFLYNVLRKLADELELGDAELGINIVGEREMTRVNETYLRHDGPTDVITFDHTEDRATRHRGRRHIHGELFICMEVAMSQARRFGTTWQSEIVRYSVHGVLHLLGYEDLKPRLRLAMKREENRLMRRLARRFSFAQLSAPARIRS